MACRDRFLRHFCAAALSTALLVGLAAAANAEADQPPDSAIALAYDSATGTLLKGHARALYQSHDEGRTWRSIPIAGLDRGQISSVAPSAAARGVMYVAGPLLGVLRTGDAGKSWVERDQGLSSRDVISVAAHTTKPDTVYAVVRGRGVYRSQDAGKSWWLMNGGAQEGLRQLIHSNLAGSMQTQTGWLYAATATGIRRVADCFCLWEDAGGLGTQAYGVTFDPNRPDQVFAVTEKGLFRSVDQGTTWEPMRAPNFDVVALVSARSDLLFAIDSDGRLYRSLDQGRTWEAVNA